MKECKKCGTQMPDEAHICLKCFTVTEIIKSDAPIEKKEKKAVPFFTAKRKKKLIASLVCIAVVTVCLFIPIDLPDEAPLTQSNGESSVPQQNAEPQATPSTTDTSAPAVEETTEKKNLFQALIKDPISNLINKDDGDNQTTSAQGVQKPNKEPTTEDKKTNLFDMIFNNNKQEDTTKKEEPTTSKNQNNDVTVNSDNTLTTVPTATVPATTAPTSAPPSTTKPITTTTTEKLTPTPISDFEWKASDESNCYIIKYNGNAKTVVIPDTIEGKYLRTVNKNCFKDNSTVETVIFEDFETYKTLSMFTSIFVNCPNLKKVVFPKNADLGLANFATNCPKLETIIVDNPQYVVRDGAFYSWNSRAWAMRLYCEGRKSTTFELPPFCTEVDSSVFSNHKYLEKIYLHKNAPYGFVEHMFIMSNAPKNLKGIYVDDGHNEMYDIDGAVFAKVGNDGRYTCIAFPSNIQATSFTFPDNINVKAAPTDVKNIKVLKIPENVTFLQYSQYNYITKGNFKDLETLYIHKDSIYSGDAQARLGDKVILYS